MLTRRNFMSLTALAAGVGLYPEMYTEASAATPNPVLTTVIGSAAVPQRKVLEWEARRLQVVAERIRHNLPGAVAKELDALILRPALATTNVARDRQMLADVKMRLGEPEMRKLMAGDLALSNPTSVLTAAPKKWSISTTEIRSSRGTAKGFASWFDARRTKNDVRAMLVACPDHYVIKTGSRGKQEVIEVTGGAVLASRFLVDYTDTAEVPMAADPRFGVQVAGCARNDEGTMIGGVRHQFHDNPGGGFTAKLAVAFPALLPPWCAPEHRWHLACEFSNWITAYAATIA
jgi:hypothetical protein